MGEAARLLQAKPPHKSPTNLVHRPRENEICRELGGRDKAGQSCWTRQALLHDLGDVFVPLARQMLL